MFVTLSGIVMLSKLSHPKNAPLHISVMLSGSIMLLTQDKINVLTYIFLKHLPRVKFVCQLKLSNS